MCSIQANHELTKSWYHLKFSGGPFVQPIHLQRPGGARLYINRVVFIVTRVRRKNIKSQTLGIGHDLREPVGLEESRTTCESVSVRSPLLSVTGLAVNVPVRAIAGDDRVQGLGAVMTLVALPVPLAALGKHLLGGEDDSTATGAALARGSLDFRGVDHGGAGSRIAAFSQRVARVIILVWRSYVSNRIDQEKAIDSFVQLSLLYWIRYLEFMLGERKTLKIGFSEEYVLNSPRFSYLYDLFVQSEKNRVACE